MRLISQEACTHYTSCISSNHSVSGPVQTNTKDACIGYVSLRLIPPRFGSLCNNGCMQDALVAPQIPHDEQEESHVAPVVPEQSLRERRAREPGSDDWGTLFSTLLVTVMLLVILPGAALMVLLRPHRRSDVQEELKPPETQPACVDLAVVAATLEHGLGGGFSLFSMPVRPTGRCAKVWQLPQRVDLICSKF